MFSTTTLLVIVPIPTLLARPHPLPYSTVAAFPTRIVITVPLVDTHVDTDSTCTAVLLASHTPRITTAYRKRAVVVEFLRLLAQKRKIVWSGLLIFQPLFR